MIALELELKWQNKGRSRGVEKNEYLLRHSYQGRSSICEVGNKGAQLKLIVASETQPVPGM